MTVTPYYSPAGDKITVLVSIGYGAGFSTWGVPELAYDHRVVEWWLEHNSDEYCSAVERFDSPENKEFKIKLREWGYGDVYLGGYADIELVWIERDRQWRIEEYDGNEHIVFADQQQWNSF